MNINLTLFGQMISFFVFVWFCMKYVWPPIVQAMEERQQRIQEGLEASERSQVALEEAEQQAGELLAQAKQQASEIIGKAEKRASSIVEEAKVSAKSEGERILTTAKAEIEQETNRAKDVLRGQLATLTVSGAEKILGQEVDASRHEALLTELASQL